MTDDNALPIGVTALRADSYSPGSKSVIVSVKTKYSNVERKYSVPVDCFYDLIADLKRLNASIDKLEVMHPEASSPTAPEEHQASCFALEEEKGEDWKGTGTTGLVINEAKSSL